MESLVDKNFFGQKSPIDRPFEEKHSAEFERLLYVSDRVMNEELDRHEDLK